MWNINRFRMLKVISNPFIFFSSPLNKTRYISFCDAKPSEIRLTFNTQSRRRKRDKVIVDLQDKYYSEKLDYRYRHSPNVSGSLECRHVRPWLRLGRPRVACGLAYLAPPTSNFFFLSFLTSLVKFPDSPNFLRDISILFPRRAALTLASDRLSAASYELRATAISRPFSRD